MFVSAHSETVLTYAIKRKNSEMVKSLIQYKVDVNKIYKGQNPLRLAVAKKQTKIVEQLLKAGAAQPLMISFLYSMVKRYILQCMALEILCVV